MRPRTTGTYTPPPMPPEAYANPYAASAVTMQMICLAARSLWGGVWGRRETRRLELIPVLPVGWDAAGRHCMHTSRAIDS